MTDDDDLENTSLATVLLPFVTPVLSTMKVVLFFSAIAGASAFAPVSQPAQVASKLSAGLEGLRGSSVESGGKNVSESKEKTITLSIYVGVGWSSYGCLFVL
jgi:hypothetical protein